MNFQVRVKCQKPGESTNYEKHYTVNASSAAEAKEQAKSQCESQGYKYKGIVSCRESK